MTGYERQTHTYQSVSRGFIALMVKEIIKGISINKKALERYNKTMHDNLCDGTSRYWKAQANGDQAIREIQDGYLKLLILDNECNWSSNLHQDRFKFLDKYPTILDEYLDTKKDQQGWPS